MHFTNFFTNLENTNFSRLTNKINISIPSLNLILSIIPFLDFPSSFFFFFFFNPFNSSSFPFIPLFFLFPFLHVYNFFNFLFIPYHHRISFTFFSLPPRYSSTERILRTHSFLSSLESTSPE